MVSVAICMLTLALCLSSGFQQGYIATVLNQPYLAIEKFINESWITRSDVPISANALVNFLFLFSSHFHKIDVFRMNDTLVFE